MRALDAGYVASFGHGDGRAWDDLLTSFRDANLYQAWSYDRLLHERHGTVNMVVHRGCTALAAAQVRLMALWGTRTGIAYVRWGPMWRRQEARADAEVFRQAVRALRNEFSRRRGLVLCLYPLAYHPGDDALATILYEEGYRLHVPTRRERTLLLDLDIPLDALRAALDQKWRNCLNRAEKSGLEVILGEEASLFDEIAIMHSQMLARKGPVDANDIDNLKFIQRALPDALKLKAVVCRLGGEPCAGAIFSAIGTTGLYVRGATSDAGLKTNGSYLVQWEFVRWLKDHGFPCYDLNGISPDRNPGTYHFKRGLAGRRGRDVEFLGRFQVADRPLSRWLVSGGDWLVSRWRRLGSAGRSLLATPGPAARSSNSGRGLSR